MLDNEFINKILQEFLAPAIGLLLGGEALALIIGIFIIKKGKSFWNTRKNRRYLSADLVVGFVLMLYYYLGVEFWFTIVTMLAVAFSILMHYKRVVEFVMKKRNAFCGNRALFFVNNLKLVLLFGLLFALIPL